MSRIIKLKDIAKIFDGTHQTPHYVDSGVPFYSVEHVTSGDFSKTKFISEEVFATESRRVTLEKGDILMTRIGDVGNAKYIDWDVRASFYVSLALLKCSEDVDPEFIAYMINSDTGRREIWAKTLHVAFPNKINLGDIGECTFSIPDKSTQVKIVHIIKTWDEFIKKLDKKIELKKNIKKGLMHQLLSGERRLPGFNEDIQHVKLGQVAKMSSGGTPKSTVTEYYGGDIYWASIADMTSGGKVLLSTLKTLTKSGLQNSAAKIYPKGTILYAMYASIGECSIAGVEMASSQAILGITPEDGHLDSGYLYHHLTWIKEKVKLSGQQGTQSNLNAGMVRDFNLSLPPLEEQKQIAKILDLADEDTQRLRDLRDIINDQKAYLLNNLISGKIHTPENLKTPAEEVQYA